MIIITLYTLLFVCSTTSQCQFHFNAYNVSFDLSPLTLPSSNSYQIAHSALSEYTFYVNFCANAQTPSSSSSQCNSADDEYAYVENDGHNNDYWCEAASGSTPTATLITSNDPSFGIILKYSGGSTNNGCTSNPRSIDIYLMCDSNVTDIQSTDIAWQYDICKYKITPIHTPYACPLSCHSNSNGQLCNNKGECGYDWNIKRARCFCFHGWSGSFCDIIEPVTSISPAMYVQISDHVLFSFVMLKLSQISSDLDNVDTSSNYVISLYSGKVIYNLSYFAVSSSDHPTGRDFNESGSSNIYYWSVFDYPLDKTECNNGDIDTAYAYQKDSYGCQSIGSEYHIWLYDPYNPVKGLTINYTQGSGQFCPYNGGRKRTFSMNLICADFNSVIDVLPIDISGQVEEIDSCIYTITLFSIAACPYQCITYSNTDNTLSLCSSNGICAYDKTVGFVRCLCNMGYTGDYCQLDGMF